MYVRTAHLAEQGLAYPNDIAAEMRTPGLIIPGQGVPLPG